MNISFTKQFNNQLDEITDPALLSKISKIVASLMAASDLRNIPHIKKMKGYTAYYRIKVNSAYRIGLKKTEEGVLLITLRQRKDIYRSFSR